MKKLFIVGTPIGNLDDITIRAIKTLEMVDVIACEDTRVTSKLLNHLKIKGKKIIAHHNFNEKQSSKGILSLLEKGLSVALVSDAGMPLISDPGFHLINEIKKNNIDYEIIPGVSALTTAFAYSGFGNEFTFLGFGKNKKTQFEKQIKNLTEGTYVIFTTAHKVNFLLEIIQKYHPRHNIFLCREMTKIYQSFYEGKAEEIIHSIKNKLRGEFTLVLKIGN